MRPRAKWTVVAVACATVVGGTVWASVRHARAQAEARRALLLPTAAQAAHITLYEGLPHQQHEAAALATELATNPTVTLHDFPFYRDPLPLANEEAAGLKATLGDMQSFVPYSGSWFCGEFHPDYCVEWEADGEVYRCLICFGCSELKVYGPRRALHLEVRPEAEQALKRILTPYRKNRPAAEGPR